MQTKYWCRSCAAYASSQCPTIGHISERMTLASGKWKPFKKPQLAIASPPASGRGSLEWVACDAEGKPLSRSA